MREAGDDDEASVPRPREELRQHLAQLGDEGQRAEAYLCEAARQIELSAPLAPECACYCVREALMALLKLGKGLGPKLDDEAPKVITAWRRYSDGAIDEEVVEEAIARLEAAQRDPNEPRLEDTILRLARSKPTRGDADLLAEFLKYLKLANTSLHCGADLEQADALYRSSLRVIDNLFGPFADRLEALDELIAIADPGPQELAKLRAFVGDNRHLAYFFSCVEGAAWIRLLEDDPLLRPAKDGTWPASHYLQKLSDSEPEQVRSWLKRFRGEDLTPEQASSLLYVAGRLENSIALVTSLTQTNLEFTPVLAQLDRYIRKLPEDQRDTKPLPRLVITTLRVLLGGSGAASQIWATRMLEFCVAAIRTSDSRVWLTVLACQLDEVGRTESPIGIRMLPRLGDIGHPRRASRSAEQVAIAVRDGIETALEIGVETDVIAEALARIEGGFGRKQQALFLCKTHPATQAEAETFLLEGAVVGSDPFPEEVDLLEKTYPLASSGFGKALLAALGAPPSLEEILMAVKERRPVGDWMRAQQWLAPVPGEERGAWAEAFGQLEESLGPPRAPGSPRFRVGSGAPDLNSEALAELVSVGPLEAARQLAAWSQPEARMYPSAYDERDQLLRQLIKRDPEAWLGVPPTELVDALEVAELISTYLVEFQGHLEEVDSAIAGEACLVAERLLARRLEAEASAEPETWGYASYRALSLCGELARRELLDPEAVERFWGVVLSHSRLRSDDQDEGEDLMTTAINRPWTVAVDIAFALLPGDDPRFLALLEECLALSDVQGKLARAIISSRLAYLRQVAPEWFARNEELIFGAAAPGDLGKLTYRLFLEWGRPSEDLLREQRSRLLESLNGPVAEQARRHLLHGLLWELESFDAAAVCAALLHASDESLSEAARWLAVSLESSEDDFSPVLALWREALSSEAGPEALAGWGWFSVNEHLPDCDWLALTLATASRERANLAEAEEVAKRAERIESDPRVIELVARLLAGEPELWELEGLTAIGLRLLRSGDGGAERRRELRERLLEREVYEARDL